VEQLLQQVLAGIANGAIYACLALALVMIFVSTDQLNFAQGEMAMFSTYLCWQLIQWGTNFWLALMLTALISFIIGMLVERIVLRP
jgi:branched-chain amino acid transport system permease protein